MGNDAQKPVAWRYFYPPGDGFWIFSDRRLHDAYEPLYAAPPDAPVKGAVTVAQIDAAAVALSKRIYKQTEGEWQPNIRQADELARAALNAALLALAGGAG